MNVCKWVEVEYKKNNDSLSFPCYPLSRWCLSRKIPIKKKKRQKKERKKKNTDRTQTKLNAPHVR